MVKCFITAFKPRNDAWKDVEVYKLDYIHAALESYWIQQSSAITENIHSLTPWDFKFCFL